MFESFCSIVCEKDLSAWCFGIVSGVSLAFNLQIFGKSSIFSFAANKFFKSFSGSLKGLILGILGRSSMFSFSTKLMVGNLKGEISLILGRLSSLESSQYFSK